MSKKDLTLEEQLYKIGLVFLVVGGILMFLYIKVLLPILPSIPCVFWDRLGVYCPGCGGTRAVQALFQGRLLASLWYHPLVMYTVLVFGGFMLTNTLERWHVLNIKGWKFHDWYLYVALVIVVVNFILKNALLMAFHITL